MQVSLLNGFYSCVHSGLSLHTFFLQVLGELLRQTTDYLVKEGRAVRANSRAKATKPNNLRLRKDLIEAMDQASEAKAKLKEVSN